MAAHGARRLARMTANLTTILGVEAMCAAQGIEQRAPLTTSAPAAGGHGLPAPIGPEPAAGSLPRPRSEGRGDLHRRGQPRACRRPGVDPMSLIEIVCGDSPLVLGLPHTGNGCAARLPLRG